MDAPGLLQFDILKAFQQTRVGRQDEENITAARPQDEAELIPVCDRSKCLFVHVHHSSIPRDVLTSFKMRACQLAWFRICVIRETNKKGFMLLRIPIPPNFFIFQTRTQLITLNAMEGKKFQAFVFHDK